MGLETIALPDVIQLLGQRELSIPLVAIGESGDEADIIEAMRQGANDLCSYDQPEHLQLVVKRELSSSTALTWKCSALITWKKSRGHRFSTW